MLDDQRSYTLITAHLGQQLQLWGDLQDIGPTFLHPPQQPIQHLKATFAHYSAHYFRTELVMANIGHQFVKDDRQLFIGD